MRSARRAGGKRAVTAAGRGSGLWRQLESPPNALSAGEGGEAPSTMAGGRGSPPRLPPYANACAPRTSPPSPRPGSVRGLTPIAFAALRPDQLTLPPPAAPDFSTQCPGSPVSLFWAFPLFSQVTGSGSRADRSAHAHILHAARDYISRLAVRSYCCQLTGLMICGESGQEGGPGQQQLPLLVLATDPLPAPGGAACGPRVFSQPGLLPVAPSEPANPLWH